MSLRKASLAAALAASMASAPVIAQAQTHASAPAVQRTSADTEDANELRGGFIIPLIALIAIILGLCAGTSICGGDDNDLPHSP